MSMSLNRFSVLAAAALALAGSSLPVRATLPDQAPPLARLEPASCAQMLARGTTGPLDTLFPTDLTGIECGFVAVPLEHAKPAGPVIKLAIAILRARDAGREPDPLVMLQGGPGGGTIDTYAASMATSALRAHRDIVLFDQRGTGKSLPALKCAESIENTRATAEIVLDHDTALKRYWAATQACRERLVREGQSLSAYDSLENAADIDSVRSALGYERVNLYGVSYGTLLALHAMRLRPEILRSVILDSVVPPQTNFVIEATRAENRALTELFAACAAAARCASDYPGLEQIYLAQIERLARAPARARMVDPETGRAFNTVIDGDAFRAILFQSLYSTELIPLLPQLIFDVRDGNFGTLGNIGGLFTFDQSVANGMYMSVICAEDADFKPADAVSPELRPALARYAVQDAAEFQAGCRAWNVEPLPGSVDDPVVSDLPTLILNGRFDPITPPRNGEDVARTLKRSFVFTFPNTGHGALQSESCAADIAGAFLDTPDMPPASACLGALSAPRFVGRGELLRIPIYGELLTAPGQGTRREAEALGISLLVLLTGLILLPLGWLARTILNRHHRSLKPPILATLMPWAVVINAMVLLAFLTGFLVAPIVNGTGGAYTFLAGVGAEYRSVFVLPWVSATLTLVTLAGTVGGLVSPAWGVLRKIYRGTLALASIAAVIVLIVWGTFSVLFQN